MTHLPYYVAVWLLLVGLYGVVSSRNLIHLVVCLAVMEASTYLVLLGVGTREHATAPILHGTAPDAVFVDPIVQALTLTDVVVGATVSSLLLSLAMLAHHHFGSLDPGRMCVLKR
ncbi:sodium:proton antiporter [Melittangium boletus]|uniref:Dehydrogenase n=1 Tax=Melittangium boletus DSM 14713 TaxID=1294270 RepID=A0A250IEU7_9BACT|nr:NADH-quinone oxidoreductase subunit K [Melittangium boletus]ATB29667.1 dehydrogenase [Melittangium boletus DSM 14713]